MHHTGLGRSKILQVVFSEAIADINLKFLNVKWCRGAKILDCKILRA